MRSKRELSAEFFAEDTFELKGSNDGGGKEGEKGRGRALLDKQISQGFMVGIHSLEVFVRR